MSRWWEVIAPLAICGFGALAYLAARFASPHPGAHAEHLGGCLAPDVHDQTVPVAEVAGRPPWDGLPPWAAPEADRYNGYGWISGSSGSDFDGAWLLPPDLEATLRGELHHVDGYEPDPFGTERIEAWVRDGMQVNWIDDSPREDGAGDESEGSGLTAPPAPLRPVDLALARCDLFMTAMRADHARWLASARVRWAAA